MNKKGLAVLLRTRMRPPSNQPPPPSPPPRPANSSHSDESKASSIGSLKEVKDWMHASISIPDGKTESVDASLRDFSQGYLGLSGDRRRDLLLALARDYDVSRMRVHELMQQYLTLEIPHAGVEEEGTLAMFYRMERNLRDALKPMYAIFFERLNACPGGLKLLTVLRANLLSVIANENIPSLRALDSYLKEKLVTWLSPAALELHQITWDDSASLLEKIVAYEAVHPIRSLLDLKRRLSVGRRCFGYLHPAIPGEPLIFIEVALLKDVAKSIQEVLWDDPPIPECEAKCALFYSISSTQPGLSGINLGKFLIKRVVELLRRDMPFITTFATLSPIPGYMQWLLSKLASQLKLAKLENKDVSRTVEKDSSSAFKENILLPEEAEVLLNSSVESRAGENAMEVMWNLLTSPNCEWKRDNLLLTALKAPLMRLCVRYLLKEKKRGKSLDPVANFHLQNGALVERINWMADPSEKGIQQSGGIMVNYVYRLDKIEENAESYINSGNISYSDNLCYLEDT